MEEQETEELSNPTTQGDKHSLSSDDDGGGYETAKKPRSVKVGPERRIQLMIEHEVFRDFQFPEKPTPSTKKLLLDFAYAAVAHITVCQEQANNMLADQVAKGFDALNKRIEVLERRGEKQFEGVTQVEQSIKKIESSCAAVTKEAVNALPNTSSMQYAKAAARILGDGKDVTTIARESKVKQGPGYIVLEQESKIRDPDDVKRVKKKLANKFRGKQIQVDNLVVTKNGNVSLEFPNRDEQKKAEQLLANNSIRGMTPRSSMEKNTHLALRSVPVEMTIEEIKDELVANNHHEVFKTNKWQVFETSTQTLPNQRFKTVKLIVPEQCATAILREERLLFDWKSVKVEMWSPGHKRCTNCFSNKHRANNNTNQQCMEIVCNTCGGDHRATQCRITNKAKFFCIVCNKARQSNFNHRAVIKECPILKDEALNEARKAAEAIHV